MSPRELPEYTVIIGDYQGNPLEEIPAKNLQFSYILNAPGAVSFTLPTLYDKSTPLLLAPGQRSIIVRRNGYDVWGGYLWTLTAAMDSIQLNGEGWFSRFKHREIKQDLTYDTEQFNIAWDLIAYTQSLPAGDLGITRRIVSASGVNRGQSYKGVERKNIADALTELAALDKGFDFEITSGREWVTYYPQKGILVDDVFDLDKNITGASLTIDATDVVTEETALGTGTDDTTLISVKSDPTSQLYYGLMQETTTWADVTIQATLDAHAIEELNTKKISHNRVQIQVTSDPPFGNYSVGDLARLVANRGFFKIDQIKRIMTITVSISDAGQENVGVFFEDPANPEGVE